MPGQEHCSTRLVIVGENSIGGVPPSRVRGWLNLTVHSIEHAVAVIERCGQNEGCQQCERGFPTAANLDLIPNPTQQRNGSKGDQLAINQGVERCPLA